VGTKIVCNQTLGLRVVSLAPELVTARIDMRPTLVGHYGYNRIHGGVIGAGLDAMGGLAVMAAIGARHMDETPAQRLHRFSKLGTIDLRVDLPAPRHSAKPLSCAPKCCAWARAWPPPAWSFWVPTASCCPAGQGLTSCPERPPPSTRPVVRCENNSKLSNIDSA